MAVFFTPREVVGFTGIKRENLKKWNSSNFIKGSYRKQGKINLYNYRDLFFLWVAKKLTDGGHSVHSLRKNFPIIKKKINSCEKNLISLNVYYNIKKIFVVNGYLILNEEEEKDFIVFSVEKFFDEVKKAKKDGKWEEWRKIERKKENEETELFSG